MRIVNTAEMRALEKAWSESAQRPLIDLMEQAGKAVWDTIEKNICAAYRCALGGFCR
ncbi:hypothetical protein [Negativicoccus succinicivorans]|uniref:hypothetical protein n=1 Tax=Negativicoccus succinicivorans TaxID=620903 RepID=UPI0028FFDDFC|nr:hypothetical protein [Negativicoccus succinicivorans]MDU2929209.1 hypothetical protein [Negativicoccus succinicivorans]